MQRGYGADPGRLLAQYELTKDERAALEGGDIGLLYVLGANGQLLMHFAAFLGLSWPAYIPSAARRCGTPWPGARRCLRHDHADGRKGGRRMSLVFAGICSHAPGITGRAGMADPARARRSTPPTVTCTRNSRRSARMPWSWSPPSTSPTSS